MFIDEIDKIVTSAEHRYGGDASAEGVQRDLLPIIEGEGGEGLRCGWAVRLLRHQARG